MPIQDALTDPLTEYLRLGQNDNLQVVEQQIDDAVKDIDTSGRASLLDEVERHVKGVASDISPDDEDRLRVLLDLVERKREAGE